MLEGPKNLQDPTFPFSWLSHDVPQLSGSRHWEVGLHLRVVNPDYLDTSQIVLFMLVLEDSVYNVPRG